MLDLLMNDPRTNPYLANQRRFYRSYNLALFRSCESNNFITVSALIKLPSIDLTKEIESFRIACCKNNYKIVHLLVNTGLISTSLIKEGNQVHYV